MVNETCPPLSVEDCPTLTQPVNKKCKFKLIIPFHRLPLLVQVQAIQTMGPKDWLNLAMTSKRNEKVVKLARLKTGYFRFEFCDDVSVHLPHLKLNVFFEKHHGRMEESFSMMTKGDMKTWLNQPFNSTIENAGILYQKMQNIFVIPTNFEITYCTDIEKKKRVTIRELLSSPIMTNWMKLSIYGKKISSEDLKMIMDTATSDRLFMVTVEEMPLDFKHENAFKFFQQIYHDARWVKIEDLYGLRNLVCVVLCRNLFTQEQLKSFVNYWVNSDVDMFWWIEIHRIVRLDFENVVDGLLGLQGSDYNYKLFLTMPTSPLNKRKKTLLSIGYDIKRRYLLLLAWDVNKKFTPSVSEKENKKFENVGMILTLLHNKKKLEDLLEEANEEAKIELIEKINCLTAALSEFNVTFIDGKVTHRLF